MISLSDRELGIANCDYVATGETVGDVVEDMVEHLEDEHDVDMPSVESILDAEGSMHIADLGLDFDLSEEAALLVRRIRTEMNLIDEETGDDTPLVPPGVNLETQ